MARAFAAAGVDVALGARLGLLLADIASTLTGKFGAEAVVVPTDIPRVGRTDG